MHAYSVAMFIEVIGLGVNPLPVIALQIIVALPGKPDRIYCDSVMRLYLDRKGDFKLLSAEITEIPYELYLAGQ